MPVSIVQDLVIAMTSLLFLVAFASASREKAADATAPARVPGVRR